MPKVDILDTHILCQQGIRRFLSFVEPKADLPYEELLFTLLVEDIKEPTLNNLYKGEINKDTMNTLWQWR
jgi:hypothetical protein